MTLPLIYSLENCSSAEKRKIINIIRKNNKNKKNLEEVLNFVKKHKGLEFAEEKMNEYKNLALDVLTYFPDNPAKIALYDLVNFTVNREK